MSSTTSTVLHDLPEFPFSAAGSARRRLNTILSSSHFVTTIVSPSPRDDPAGHRLLPQVAPPSLVECNTDQAQEHADPRQDDQEDADTYRLHQEIFATSTHVYNPFRSQSSIHRRSPLHHAPSRATRQTPDFSERVVSLGRRRRSTWGRIRRMGNHLAFPVRSMLTCCPGGQGLCEHPSDEDEVTSWCRSGQYSPQYIRAVLENNVLFGQVSLE